MKISEPIVIRKTGKGYEITGSLDGIGKIRLYGSSEEEAKRRFFDACSQLADLGRTACAA